MYQDPLCIMYPGATSNKKPTSHLSKGKERKCYYLT